MAEKPRPPAGRRNVVVLALVLIVVLAGIGEWGYSVFVRSGPPAPKGRETVIVIAPGAGLHAISRQLAAAGVIRDASVFYAGVRLTGHTQALKAGEYAIPGGASMRAVMEQLIAGHSIVHKITIAEGLTSKMAYDLVRADTVLSGPPGPVPAEGTLLPETYVFPRATTRRQLLQQMRNAQTRLLDALWPGRAKGLPIETRREAVILASIVEKETALPEERRHIAAVFINRLRIGMRLQSDPTIIYGVSRGYPLGRGIRKSEIEAETPYNTYVVPGLPGGPICNPGRDAIEAVLHPADSKDLYFVADGTGGHQFAATLAEQTRNVRKWRRIEKKRRRSQK